MNAFIKKIIRGTRNKLVKQKPLTAFGEKIQQRNYRLWTEPHLGRHDGDTCRNELLMRTDSLEAWHCCPLWQRKLSNKWNSREFASKLGIRVPDLYWHGRDLRELDFRNLPSHYVVRSAIGHSSKGVFVMAEGVNLLDTKAYSEAELKKVLARVVEENPATLLLVEEFVKTESGQYQLPVEYKVHTFNDHIAGIYVVRRKTVKQAKHRFYTAEWKPFSEVMMRTHPLDDLTNPPKCLEEMLAFARTLGKAYGAFVRIDFYATDKGCVFSEFTPTPTLGRGYTPYASQYFLKLWQETYPDLEHI